MANESSKRKIRLIIAISAAFVMLLFIALVIYIYIPKEKLIATNQNQFVQNQIIVQSPANAGNTKSIIARNNVQQISTSQENNAPVLVTQNQPTTITAAENKNPEKEPAKSQETTPPQQTQPEQQTAQNQNTNTGTCSEGVLGEEQCTGSDGSTGARDKTCVNGQWVYGSCEQAYL